MYAPEGFVSLDSIARSSRKMMRGSNASSAMLIAPFLDGKDTRARAMWMVQCHPLQDIFESVLFEQCYENDALYICTHSGLPLKLEMPFHQVDFNIRILLQYLSEYFQENQSLEIEAFISRYFRVQEAYWRYKSFMNNFEKGSDFAKFSQADFKIAKQIWVAGTYQVDLFWDESTFAIRTRLFDDLVGLLGIDTMDPIGNGWGGHMHEVLSRFNGCSMCVKRSFAKTLEWDRIFQSVMTKFIRIYIGDYGNLNEGSSEQAAAYAKMGGRPRKQEEATNLLLQGFSISELPSWGRCVEYLEKEHGFKVAERTLQRGISALKDKKSEDIN